MPDYSTLSRRAEMLQVRRDRGDLGGPDVRLEIKHGAGDIAVGDQVQFTDTDKRRHIYNGNAGVITDIDTRTTRLMAWLNAAAGTEGREVTWAAAKFDGLWHGYAGTIYKGQGRTRDHTFLLHTPHWRAASYVALTLGRRPCSRYLPLCSPSSGRARQRTVMLILAANGF